MKTNNISQTNAVEAPASRNREKSGRRLTASLRVILSVAVFTLAALFSQTAQAQILSVSPATATVAKGGTQQFTASNRKTLMGSDADVTASATWTVTGNASASTTISSAGLLTVAASETNQTLTVKASYTVIAGVSAVTASATVTVPGNLANVEVETLPATGVTQTSAVLHGKITSDGGSTVTGKKIRWRQKGHAYFTDVTSLQGNNSDLYTAVSGLTASTEYEFMFVATDSRGDWNGSILTFTTASSAVTAPTVETLHADEIMQNSAKVHGRIVSDGNATITFKVLLYKQKGSSDAFAYNTAPSGSNADLYVTLTGLQPNTTYQYRIRASNSAGTTDGDIAEFTTLAAVIAPTVQTLAATDITATTARLHGKITNNGNSTITAKGFGYNKKGATTPATVNAAGGDDNDFIVTVTGLDPGATYEYYATGVNGAGTGVGGWVEFTTTATSPTVTSVTVSPATPTVAKGSTQQFTATVAGTNSPSQDVTWQVSSDNTNWSTSSVGGNAITNSGLLSVVAGTTLSTIYVKATSVYDNTKAGYATVTVTNASNITSVTVTPATASVPKGGTQQFSAVANGATGTQGGISWQVSVDNSNWSSTSAGGNSITGNGLLTVSATTAASTVYVKATSTYNTTKSATATVTVTAAAATPVITISEQPQDVTKAVSETKTLSVTASVSPAQNITIQWYKKEPGATSYSGAGGASYPGGSATKTAPLPNTLQPGTHLYYAKIYITNDPGVYVDTRLVTVTVMAAATNPTVQTLPATDITTTSAVLHGKITSDGGATIAENYFAYREKGYTGVWATSNSIGSDNDLYVTINWLQPNTTYEYRLTVKNSAGLWAAYDIKEFTTLASADVTPPVISNLQAVTAQMTATSAYVQFTLDEQAKCYSMIYLATASAPSVATVKAQGSAVWKAVTPNIPAGGTNSRNITGLSPSTAYKFYIVAEDAAGNTSAVESCAFTTTASSTITRPTIQTLPATGISATSATLHGKITSNGGATITMKGFTYSVKGSGNWMTRPESEIIGTEVDYALPLMGRLQPATTYEYRFHARNSAGETISAEAEFTTSAGLGVDTESLGYTAAGGTKYVRIVASVNWTATSSAAWLTVTPASGTGNETLNAVAAANATASVRTATVTVTDGSYTRVVDVTQAAGSGATVTLPAVETRAASAITATSARLGGRVTGDGGEAVSFFGISFKKTADALWNTSTSDIAGTAAGFERTLTGLDPDTDYEFIAFAQNSAGRGDGARLTFHTPAASPGSTLDVSPASLSFAAAGEAKTLQVAANVGWTASADASWLTVSPASGTNSGTVTATAAANTSASQRTSVITVTGGGITRTLGVTQAAGPVTQPSGNNALSSLSIEGVALSPLFNPSVTDYRAAVPNAVTSLTVRAQAEDTAGATVAVTGSSGLQVGENTVTVRVTAANGSVRTYTVTVMRDAPTSTEAVATAPRAWSSGGILYVSVPQPSTLQVYTLTGIPAVNRPVPEGQTAIPLPHGIYIVRLGDRMTVKVPVR